MNKSLEDLPEPDLRNLRISELRKTDDKARPVRVDYLDTLLDKKFTTNYFKEKMTEKYIDERRSY